MSDEEGSIQMEVMMILNMYEESASQPDPLTLHVDLPFSFVLEVQFPPTGYPGYRLPSFNILSGPNVSLLSAFQTELREMVSETITCGQDNVGLLVLPMAIQLAEIYMERHAKEIEEEEAIAAAAAAAELEEEDEEEEEDALTSQFLQSAPICDRKSKFIAHCTRVHSMEDVHNAIRSLRSRKQIAVACHPTIWAYRYRDVDGGFLVSDMDDDGEHGASSRIMFLLEQLHVEGFVVVVTRWFGGILLGPDRFKHIMTVTRDVLLQAVALTEAASSIAKRGKSKVTPS